MAAAAPVRTRHARARRGRAIGAHGDARTAHRGRRPGREIDLPVLRGRLRSIGVRQGREGRAGRGRSRLADLARPAVRERVGDARARAELATRAATWEAADEQGRPLNRTMGIASLGGATLDNEENYLMKKLYSALGVVQVENQARL